MGKWLVAAYIGIDVVQNSIIGRRIKIQRSSDDGATWEDPIIAYDYGTSTNNPTRLRITSDLNTGSPNVGCLYLTWAEFSSPYAIAVMASCDQGHTWYGNGQNPFYPTGVTPAGGPILLVQKSIPLGQSYPNLYLVWKDQEYNSNCGTDTSNPPVNWPLMKIGQLYYNSTATTWTTTGSIYTINTDRSECMGAGKDEQHIYGYKNVRDPAIPAVQLYDDGANNKTVYVAWPDSEWSRPLPLATRASCSNIMDTDAWTDPNGYCNDILFSKSSNNGQSWATPVAVNKDPQGVYTSYNHFTPVMSLQHQTAGDVLNVVYYGRNSATSPYPVHLFAAQSADGGGTWDTEVRLTSDASQQAGTPGGPIYLSCTALSYVHVGSDGSGGFVYGNAYMLGDYQGLMRIGSYVYPFYTTAYSPTSSYQDCSSGSLYEFPPVLKTLDQSGTNDPQP